MRLGVAEPGSSLDCGRSNRRIWIGGAGGPDRSREKQKVCHGLLVDSAEPPQNDHTANKRRIKRSIVFVTAWACLSWPGASVDPRPCVFPVCSCQVTSPNAAPRNAEGRNTLAEDTIPAQPPRKPWHCLAGFPGRPHKPYAAPPKKFPPARPFSIESPPPPCIMYSRTEVYI